MILSIFNCGSYSESHSVLEEVKKGEKNNLVPVHKLYLLNKIALNHPKTIWIFPEIENLNGQIILKS